MLSKKISRVLSLIMIFCFMFTTVASAITLTDIENHWAKDNIEKAVELGIIKGNSDGTFKPEDAVTMRDALIMLSRLYDIDDSLRTQIENKYTPIIKEMTDGKDSWSYNDLAVAFALDIVDEDSFKKIIDNNLLTKPTSRQQVAIFMAKAMTLSDKVKELSQTIYTMTFKDAGKISTSARPYVHLMNTLGIINGDNNGYFNPTNSIKRAEFATMAIRCHDYLDEHEIKPKFDEFETLTSLNGTILSTSETSVESYIEVVLDDGEEQIVRVNDSTVIKIDKKISKFSKLEKGMIIDFKIDSKSIAREITVSTTTKIVEGVLKSIYFVEPAKIKIEDEDGDDHEYSINKNVAITLDGKNIELRNLVKNDSVSVRLEDDVVTRVDSTSRLQTYDGKIKDIIYEIPIKLVVETKDKKVMTFTYETEPEITRNDKETSFDQLRVGDDVLVGTTYGVLTAIDAKAVAAETTGTIKEITIGNTNKVKIMDKDGDISEYNLSNTAKISVLNMTSSIYDLRVGYEVNINLDGNTIVALEANETETSQQINGKVIYVNYETEMIMTEVKRDNQSTEIVYITAQDRTTVMTLTGSKMRFKDITIGDELISVGSYSGGNFNAVSIIVK